MAQETDSRAGSNPLLLVVYWLVVGVPLGWGVWRTLMTVPALFK